MRGHSRLDPTGWLRQTPRLVMTDVRIEELKGLLPRCLLHDWVRLGSRLARLLRDRNHPGRHDALIDRLLERARASAALREWRAANVPRPQYPPHLPIAGRREEIVAALKAHQVVVVAGETGSGKTTQLPKMCLEAGMGIEAKIGCTQPRRVAALSISRRIADELNVTWGREVGCKIRFDDRSSPQTFVKLMTDGILLAEVQGDPLLSEYNAIVLDEAHERSLNIDFLLGHLQGLLRRRQDLKLVITSATIDTAAFARAFGGAPVIEVSGRMFPVEVEYAPLDARQEELGELTYVDAAVRAAGRIAGDSGDGDVLIFMPGERDIRETADLLGSRLPAGWEVIPLYGRLSAGDQQRVFAPGGRRRVIVATNIAETSLTLPGIRYVIDSGLARISRYNPRTRTRRLPIEPISQSSAHQRKGRAGRVRDGVCIRLYSEEDFAERPPFTQPEIQRANLAEVILRMKAFHLGEMETFPFLNPPSPPAVQAGYGLLQELGALDGDRQLTPLGRDLARLPIDPTLGRMLLQAQQEHAVRELLIIASGLSIQDPRERPLDQQAAADAAHRRYVHPRSDFLTLLHLWNAVHDQWESLGTQNQRRKFCRTNFLSYIRMREWQDLHAQLHDALEELGTVRLNESNAAYDAVHRSVLAGLLGHVARREERNQYLGIANRRLQVFPGSTVHERVERPPRGRPGKGNAPGRAPAPPSNQPPWIVAGEIVETTQVFARTLAGIEPTWIVELAPHLCRVTHLRPHWSASAGRVLVEEVTTFSGLEVRRRNVAYGNLNPDEATAIFIRSALVEEDLLPPRPTLPDDEGAARDPRRSKADLRTRLQRIAETLPAAVAGIDLPAAFRFVAHNRRVRQKIEDWQTRVRRTDAGDVDQALFDFYAARLKGVSSRDELHRWLGASSDPQALCASEADLTGGRRLEYDVEAFPDAIAVEGQPVELRYAYAPGEDHDGVTVRLPFSLADAVSTALLEWAVPGLREAKAEELLRGLPKSLRSQLLPIAPKASEIARDFRPAGPSLGHDLSRFVLARYGVNVPPSAWALGALPTHLRARVEVVGPDLQPLAAHRDLGELRAQLARVPAAAPAESGAWRRLADHWERFDLSGWTFGDLPERLTVSEGPGLPVYAWPGLEVDAESGRVNLRLHRTQGAARAGNLAGMRRLAELVLGKDLAWLRKDLRALRRLAPLYAALGTAEDLEETAYHHLLRHILPAEVPAVLTESAFLAAVAAARARIPGLAVQLADRLQGILELRDQVARRLGVPAPAPAPPASRVVKDLRDLTLAPAVPPRGWPGGTSGGTPAGAPAVGTRPGLADLETLLPRRFLERTPWDRLPHLPRYLKALLLRIERAASNPLKDRERSHQLAPYLAALRALEAEPGSAERARAIEDFRWLIEEYRVSVFAQELGTLVPVSPKRLEERLAQLKRG